MSADDLYHNPRRAKWEGEIGDAGGGEGGRAESENKLFVGNLDRRVNEYMILKLFAKYGKIVREQFMWHHTGPRRGEPRGFCFVEYKTKEEALKAKRELDGTYLAGRPLRVRFSEERVAIGSSAAETEESTVENSTEENFTSGADDEYSLDAKMAALRQRLAGYQQSGTLGASKKMRTSTTTSSTTAYAGLAPHRSETGAGRGRDNTKPAWLERQEKEKALRDAVKLVQEKDTEKTDLEKLTSEDS